MQIRGSRLLARAAVAALVAGLCVAGPAAAQDMPDVLPYQGMLTDADGAPLDGSVDITFRLYESSDAAEPVWTEAIDDAIVEEGVFYVYLGQEVAVWDDLIDGQTRYLGIEINGDGEMAPRQKVGAVPYAVLSGNARALGGYPADTFVTQNDLDARGYLIDADIVARNYVTNAEIDARILNLEFLTGDDLAENFYTRDEIDELLGNIQVGDVTIQEVVNVTVEQVLEDGNYTTADDVNVLIDARGYLSEGAVDLLIDARNYRNEAQIIALILANGGGGGGDGGGLSPDQVNALIDARGYLNAAAIEAVIAAGGYTSENRVNELIDARGYLNAAGINALIDARNYLTADDANGLIDVRGYQTADNVNALIDARAYLNAAAINALIDARGYQSADNVNALIDARNYLDAAGVNALIDARNYVSADDVTNLINNQINNGNFVDADAVGALIDARNYVDANAVTNLITNQINGGNYVTQDQLDTAIANLQNQINNLDGGNNNAGGGAGDAYLLGVSAATTGKINVNGFVGLAGADELCRQAYAAEPTAHMCTFHEVQRAIAGRAWDADNQNFGGVDTYTATVFPFQNGAFNDGDWLRGTCQQFMYNSGDVATSTVLRVQLDYTSDGGGGNVTAPVFHVVYNQGCAANRPVLCCR